MTRKFLGVAATLLVFATAASAETAYATGDAGQSRDDAAVSALEAAVNAVPKGNIAGKPVIEHCVHWGPTAGKWANKWTCSAKVQY